MSFLNSFEVINYLHLRTINLQNKKVEKKKRVAPNRMIAFIILTLIELANYGTLSYSAFLNSFLLLNLINLPKFLLLSRE